MSGLDRNDVSKLAAWMIKRGYATGHGDTIEDLLAELDWQIKERIAIEREECAKVAETVYEDKKQDDIYWGIPEAVKAIRERALTKLNKAAEDNGEPL